MVPQQDLSYFLKFLSLSNKKDQKADQKFKKKMLNEIPIHKYPSVHSTGYQTSYQTPNSKYYNSLDDGFSDFYGQEEDVTDCPDLVTYNTNIYHNLTQKRKSLELYESPTTVIKRSRLSASSTICNNMYKACQDKDIEAFGKSLDSIKTLFTR